MSKELDIRNWLDITPYIDTHYIERSPTWYGYVHDVHTIKLRLPHHIRINPNNNVWLTETTEFSDQPYYLATFKIEERILLNYQNHENENEDQTHDTTYSEVDQKTPQIEHRNIKQIENL